MKSDANEIHKKARMFYDIDENVESALKQEVIAVVEETYLYANKTDVHGVPWSYY